MRSYYAGLAMQSLLTSVDYTNDELGKQAFGLAEEIVKRLSTNQYDNQHINKN